MLGKLLIPFILLLASIAIADDGSEHHTIHIEIPTPVEFIYFASILIAVVTIILFVAPKWVSNNKKLVFNILMIPIIIASLYLTANTIFHNVTSVTKGPVHWHADYQVWACGERLDLIDPRGLSNKIGSPLFHEHNDDRVHVEGVVMLYPDVSLGSFFEVIGGKLTSDHITYPTTEGIVSYSTGESCPNGQQGSVNVYVNGDLVEDPAPYVLYPHINVPPGDCIIIEFEPNQNPTTDKLCSSWEVEGWNYDNYEELRKDGS